MVVTFYLTKYHNLSKLWACTVSVVSWHSRRLRVRGGGALRKRHIEEKQQWQCIVLWLAVGQCALVTCVLGWLATVPCLTSGQCWGQAGSEHLTMETWASHIAAWPQSSAGPWHGHHCVTQLFRCDNHLWHTLRKYDHLIPKRCCLINSRRLHKTSLQMEGVLNLTSAQNM